MKNPILIPPDPIDAKGLSIISLAAKRHWNYPEEWIQAWLPELHISADYIRENQLLKAVSDGQALGFCAVEKYEGYFEIAHLWVLPAFIGKGIGKRLLAESIAAYVPDGSAIRVVADPYAEAFYARQGFVTQDQLESFPPGRFLPVMWRQLAKKNL